MRLTTPMAGRDPGETHRPSTPLELFVDLTFVVAVGFAAEELHETLSENDIGHAAGSFLAVFFAVLWAWMGFTWFASAFDTDDVVYRLLVFVQMIGVLVLAAGVAQAFEDQDFAIVTGGYVIMRAALVCLWLRAAQVGAAHRSTAYRYATGIAILQVGWIARLALPESLFWAGFIALVVVEIAVPIWAESAARTPWHPRHMAERLGLFTIIVIGESIVAGTAGVQAELDGATTMRELGSVIAGGLLIVFSMWWVYFDMPTDRTAERIHRTRNQKNGLARTFGWGYGHIPLLASAAAVGAGFSVAIDHATDQSELSATTAALTATVPAALFVLSVWAIHFLYVPHTPTTRYVAPLGAVAIVLVTFGPMPLLAAGIVMALLAASLAVASPT